MSTWSGNKLKVQIFGNSHAPKMGVNLINFPHEEIDFDQLNCFLNRRKPTYSPTFGGKTPFTTRVEEDKLNILSGIIDNTICQDEVSVTIDNLNVRKTDYDNLYAKPRPSHADYACYLKDGRLDFSGGGEFSGRMTAPFCVAGGIAKQFLNRRGVSVNAYVYKVGNVCGLSYKSCDTSKLNRQQIFPSLSNGENMLKAIMDAKNDGDSIGGVIECVINGFPGGIGGELFDGLEGKLANIIYSIPGVKGVEFGLGFGFADTFGSKANDQIKNVNGKIVTVKNDSGGINGGISNGMQITLSVAFRPTPSIGKPQNTVDLLTGENVQIQISGRHDACFVPRAVPVVESAVCIALLDSVL